MEGEEDWKLDGRVELLPAWSKKNYIQGGEDSFKTLIPKKGKSEKNNCKT